MPGGRGEAVKVTSLGERDCLVRAMYFESNRSSRDGLMAVGTVVMNRVASPHFPNTVCGVVGQRRQFAAGVLTRPLNPRELPLVHKAADAILKGERYAPVGGAMHFHVASLRIPYRVRYVAVAGGNAFYLKTGRRFRHHYAKETATTGTVEAQLPPRDARSAGNASVAAATPQPGFLERLFAGVGTTVAGSQGAKPCQTTTTFGATSLACETEAAGR
jgi:spore germination cell wall hydrolase CwlJ-like protein